MTEQTKIADPLTTEAEPAKLRARNGGQFDASARKRGSMGKEEINPWKEDQIKMENPATAGDPGFF